MEKERTIRVTGKGLLKIKPDMTCVSMTVDGVERDYEEAVRRSAEDSRAVKEALAKAGFSSEEIKTTRNSIDPEYEGYEENGVWKQRFKGYRFFHELRFSFDSDRETLGKVFGVLASCPAEPEFRVSFAVKDEEAAKQELIRQAVADAKRKAVILAESSGVSLQDILHIDYSFGQLRMEVMPMEQMKLMKQDV